MWFHFSPFARNLKSVNDNICDFEWKNINASVILHEIAEIMWNGREQEILT